MASRTGPRFPDEKLWTRPGGIACVGFHLQHMRGVVDRLFTYAAAQQLSDVQRAELEAEGVAPASDATTDRLVDALRDRVHQAVVELSAMDERTLTDRRAVGRRQLPATVQGLLFHAAEHVQRHVGQLLVTVRIQHSDTVSA
jgi:uncharacterized damage-inducible protein DinB